eukprot:TRINITY_DN1805_c0_g1_i3.p1 TRINITY_DN1805_c0_g1~~TRINITY_DN1805_c0_g1_i3.p1  ORF type:complete len:787 (-),score=181.35 TRINITY_DN1805_c0_g1_i3:43-2256(-)
MEDPVYHYDHEDLKISEELPWDEMNHISLWELTRQFRVKIVGVNNLPKAEDQQIYVQTELYHGGGLVAPAKDTMIAENSPSPRWYQWITIDIPLCNIPRATRICFTLYSQTKQGKADEPLAWVALQLFDFKHELRTGLISREMWPNERANPIGTCNENTAANGPVLFLELDSYPLPVVFPTEPAKDSGVVNPLWQSQTVSTQSMKVMKIIGNENISHIDQLIQKDPLYQLTPHDKIVMWQEREYCKKKGRSLPKFLQSVPYNDRSAVQTMHSLLKEWAPIRDIDSLQLLDSNFADSTIRNFAVKSLENLDDEKLSDRLLQLIQVLKYEPYHDSELARFLLRRALSTRKIGHEFFWHLKSEVEMPAIKERYGLLLEAYLRGCGIHRYELNKQVKLLKELVGVAKTTIKNVQAKAPDALPRMREDLSRLKLDSKLPLPLNPSIEVVGLAIEKCKYMDSKKLPLWLVFNNHDLQAPKKYVIFKSGDDLRQDMLTLQMLRLMDKLWKEEGLDLKMSPYGCIATGDMEGMIEVVLNSETCASITKMAGGANAAFASDPFAKWLKEQNPTEEGYYQAVNNFVHSCAGYCVATYVLGIGDRHNDNYMITKDGKLFHIDFGHFLGNYKKKFGIKRERAPFVFTPAMEYVMGGKDSDSFKLFLGLGCRAYNVLRKHANLFINLFAMMLSTGIPELTKIDDLNYLKEAFSLDQNDEFAEKKWTDLVFQSLATKSRQMDDWVHIMKHA